MSLHLIAAKDINERCYRSANQPSRPFGEGRSTLLLHNPHFAGGSDFAFRSRFHCRE
jgi:hypothetical protein